MIVLYIFLLRTSYSNSNHFGTTDVSYFLPTTCSHTIKVLKHACQIVAYKLLCLVPYQKIYIIVIIKQSLILFSADIKKKQAK